MNDSLIYQAIRDNEKVKYLSKKTDLSEVMSSPSPICSFLVFDVYS